MSIQKDILSRAHAAWEMQLYEQAAELFLQAEQLEREAAARRGKFALADQSFLYRVNASLCLWDAGRFAEARPILEQALHFDWKAARLWSARTDTEKAYTRFLMELAVNGDREGFLTLWQHATRRGEELAYPFPTIVPHQKQLISATISLGLPHCCRQVLARLDPYFLGRDNELRLLKAQGERFCSGGM